MIEDKHGDRGDDGGAEVRGHGVTTNTKRGVVSAKAGTHTPCRNCSVRLLIIVLYLSWTPVVMGPRFRGDDDFKPQPPAPSIRAALGRRAATRRDTRRPRRR